MLTLHFEHPATRDDHSIGPAPYFRFAGSSLRAGPQDQEVASYAGGMWHINGRSFTTVTPQSPATVRFESADQSCSETYGPFDQVRLVDGFMRYGNQFKQILARLDEQSQLWYVYPAQRDCPTAMLVTP